ncbi:hypothetical protein GCK72_007632 [Caenorhabditis remanei]|uniref:Uncharacterized protein n=1 Tax=Caenorhabditis remanei TaxID=31234 RepID=A0A6A5HMT3_CAERE|nr:hypothetical protein GCK72_007632 [Caenorhabditis remanei]KAF1767673.1 hypothetical protein GCK72_007632 [Caenorhabditis remanei]
MLQYESLKHVIQYMSIGSRTNLRRRCPSLQVTESLFPLRINHLEFSENSITLNQTKYYFCTVYCLEDPHTKIDHTEIMWDLNEMYDVEIRAISPGDLILNFPREIRVDMPFSLEQLECSKKYVKFTLSTKHVKYLEDTLIRKCLKTVAEKFLGGKKESIKVDKLCSSFYEIWSDSFTATPDHPVFQHDLTKTAKILKFHASTSEISWLGTVLHLDNDQIQIDSYKPILNAEDTVTLVENWVSSDRKAGSSLHMIINEGIMREVCDLLENRIVAGSEALQRSIGFLDYIIIPMGKCLELTLDRAPSDRINKTYTFTIKVL